LLIKLEAVRERKEDERQELIAALARFQAV
jgi:hypothetical protein